MQQQLQQQAASQSQTRHESSDEDQFNLLLQERLQVTAPISMATTYPGTMATSHPGAMATSHPDIMAGAPLPASMATSNMAPATSPQEALIAFSDGETNTNQNNQRTFQGERVKNLPHKPPKPPKPVR